MFENHILRANARAELEQSLFVSCTYSKNGWRKN